MAEQEGLRDLFGEPGRWGTTLKSLLWTQCQAIAPAFKGSVVVELLVPCSWDLSVAASKYFYALDGGEVPLLLLFSGTVFHTAPDGALQAAMVPWSKEARFRLPVSVWRQMMDHYFPLTAPLTLSREVFDRLNRFKVDQGLPTVEQAVLRLLARTAQ